MTSPLQQKLRVTGPVIVTANRLADGVVVHRSPDGSWSPKLEKAEVLTSADTALAALKAAQADGLNAVGPYVAPIDKDASAIQPGNLRETIRVAGPHICASIRWRPHCARAQHRP